MSQLPLLPGSTSGYPWQADHPTWQKISRFFSLWCEPTSLLHQKTDQAWLAFDLDKPVPEVPIPGIFYCSIHKVNSLPTIQLLANIFRDPLEVAQLSNNLARCFRHIPGSARVNQVGFGLLRNCGNIRLQVVNLSPQEIPAYLAAVGWAYPTAPLQALLNQFSRCDLLTLMIDVSTIIHPKIGIEGVLNVHDTRWQILLDDLVEQGLCQSDKRDFLVSFPGVKLCRLDFEVSLTMQRLSHIKMAYHPEATSVPFEAKAYLAYYPHWLSAATNDIGG